MVRQVRNLQKWVQRLCSAWMVPKTEVNPVERISMDPTRDQSLRTGPLMARSDSARQEESVGTTLV